MRSKLLSTGSLALLLAISALGLGTVGVAAKAPTPDRIAAAAGSGSVVAVKSAPSLLNATRRTIQGTPENGGCKFTPPKLTLAPSQTATEADEISVDTASCLSIWQIGTPTDLSQPSGPNYSSQRQSVGPSLLGPASLGSSSGYEYAWLTDVINITLTSDQSNISWAWDGSCVRAASGSANWTWDNYTGWGAPYNKGSWISTNCNYSLVWSQASFQNGVFCWPQTVYSYYSGVYVEGTFDNHLYGWVNSMWNSNSCLPLWQHSRLVRVTG